MEDIFCDSIVIKNSRKFLFEVWSQSLHKSGTYRTMQNTHLKKTKKWKSTENRSIQKWWITHKFFILSLILQFMCHMFLLSVTNIQPPSESYRTWQKALQISRNWNVHHSQSSTHDQRWLVREGTAHSKFWKNNLMLINLLCCYVFSMCISCFYFTTADHKIWLKLELPVVCFSAAFPPWPCRICRCDC